MSRLLFVEGIPARLEVVPGDRVVALTAQAAGWLEERGVRYGCPSDFGSEARLAARSETHFQEQTAWLDRLDRFLWESVPALEGRALKPARLYGYFLKALVDNLLIRGEECLGALSDGRLSRPSRPAEVILWPEPGRVARPEAFFAYSLQPRGITSRLLSHVCALRGIPHRTGAVRQSAGLQVGAARWSALFSRLRPAGTGAAAPGDNGRLTLLFLEQQYDLKDLLAEALQAGHRCLIRKGRRFLDLAAGGRCLYTAPPAGRPASPVHPPDPVWEQTARVLLNLSHPLWEWPDRLLPHPLSPLLRDCLAGWVGRVLPEMVFWSDGLCELYQREGVDFVLAPALTGNLPVAAVAACRPPSEAQSILIAHGDGADLEPAWDLFELFPYQHYFVPDQEFADHFRRRRALYAPPVAQVHTGTLRWKRYAGLRDRAGKRCPLPEALRGGSKPVVVYACGKPECDAHYLNTFDYPEVDYFRLQRALVTAFASVRDFIFVVKLFPGDRRDRTALGRLVRGLQAAHLFLSEAPFTDWLPWADRVILETPSTPMYEAALAGVPFHLLAPASVQFRLEAIRPFLACVTLFRDPAEAAAQALQRLRAATPPSPSIRPEETGILEALARLRALNDGS